MVSLDTTTIKMLAATSQQSKMAPVSDTKAAASDDWGARLEAFLTAAYGALWDSKDNVRAEILRVVVANPALKQCSLRSLFIAVGQARDMGLKIDTPAGEAFILIDRSSLDPVAKLIPGYLGYLKLGYESGAVAKWEMHAVYAGDTFEMVYGTTQSLVHKPSFANRGELVGVYSFVVLTNGQQTFVALSAEDIEKVRALSATPDSWAWKYYYEAMAKAKVAKVHAKTLPKTDKISLAINADDTVEVEQGKQEQARIAEIATKEKQAKEQKVLDGLNVMSKTHEPSPVPKPAGRKPRKKRAAPSK
jgi:phage RecT family recombinase